MVKNYKKNSVVDEELINRFRSTINFNQDFFILKYSDIDNKNLWNLICSCMDWITVAINYINEFPSLSKNIDVKCMQIYSYISSIDIVYEGVKQLNRSINNQQKSKLPFDNEYTIFKNTHYDDDKYFKEIRARFGAHPVNLGGEDGERLYASWPLKSRFDDYDLKIKLYSNRVGREDTSFGIKISELNEYLISRYNYLEILINKLNDQYQQFCNEQINRKIEISDNIINQLKILLNESKLRLFVDYTRIIEELIIIFDTRINIVSLKNEEINFRKSLLPLIDEIKNNLQNMLSIDLNNESKLGINNYNKISVYVSTKLSEWIFCDNGAKYIEELLNRINDSSNSKYQLDIKDGKNLIFLKLNLLCHFND